MPQMLRKKCSRCKTVFESAGSKGCSCGSHDFKFTNEGLTKIEVEGIPVTIKPCTCSFCPINPEAMVAKYHPESVPSADADKRRCHEKGDETTTR